MNQKQIKKFWSLVNKKSGVYAFFNGKLSQCWIWTGSLTNKTGYGQCSGNKRTRRAHRVSWELKRGFVPKGLFVLHKCDNPSCVRLSHLFLGTSKDNSEDMKSKDRSYGGDRHWTRTNPEKINPAKGNRHGWHTHPEKVPRGEKHGMAKLTRKRAIQLKRLVDSRKYPRSFLAVLFEVSEMTIYRIAGGYHWVSKL